MEPTLGATACLICFETTGKPTFVPSDGSEKIFHSCNTYLHSTISKETQNIIQQNKEKRLPLCTSCFNSASELTRLSEQLTTIQKDLSDLSVAFSMAVFHRRSQVYTLIHMQNNSQCVNNSSVIEFKEVCLPPNLFSTKSINHNESNRGININNLPTGTNIINAKPGNSDPQCDHISETNHPFITNDVAGGIQTDTNVENLDKHCRQHTTERNRNTPEKQIGIVHVAAGIDLNSCTNNKNGMQSATSNVSDKSIRMPEIRLERIKVAAPKVKIESSVVNSFNSNGEKRPKIPKDGSNTSYAHSSGGEQVLKTFYYEKQECHPNIHHKPNDWDTPYTCSFCEQKFVRRSQRITHQKAHYGNSSSNRSLGEEKLHTQNALIKHRRIHTGNKCFVCHFCQQSFANLRDLNIHKRKHTAKKIKCSFCPKQYAILSSVKRHEKRHMGMEKLYDCSYCKKCFHSKSYLKIHESIHRGEKPFKCSFCDKRFAHSSNMKIHEKIHTGEKPFECSFCHKRFAHYKTLKDHESIHTRQKPFECLFCHKRFSRSSTLKVHERTHTEEKRLTCAFCENSFSTKNRLETHMRRHPGEKPCSKALTARRDLLTMQL